MFMYVNNKDSIIILKIVLFYWNMFEVIHQNDNKCLRFFFLLFIDKWLSLIWLCSANVLFITESGNVNDAVVQDGPENKKSKTSNLDERIFCPCFAICTRNDIMNKQINCPNNNGTTSVDECAMNARHVFRYRKTEEVVERDGRKIQQTKD